MLRTWLLFASAVVMAALAGCEQRRADPDAAGGPVPWLVIPDAEEVTAVHVRVLGGPATEKLFPGAPFELRLTERRDIARVVAWLKTYDWSRAGKDLRAVKLAVSGSLELIRENQPPLRFHFTPDGGAIYENGLRGGDIGPLREVILRHRNGG